MVAPSFEYRQASSVEEAVELLSKNKDAKLLAGGHSLLPAMKLRVSSPPMLIDLRNVEDLSGIEASDGTIRIGAMTTHAAIADSEEVRAGCPILSETAEQIGDLQVRNRGTIGGSLAHADPAADYPTTMLALGATLVAVGPDGSREIPVSSFFDGLFATALQPNEVLTEVWVPAMAAGQGGAYRQHQHPASSYAVVGVAALVTLAEGQCSEASVAVGGATANPVVAESTQQALVGQPANEETFSSAADLVVDALNEPLSDLYASGEYRQHLATVLARRALAAAASRASG